ncbi:MAG: hypothetical protein A4E73_00288 [Syntrophaceae bacterium PtaU1.Bin231]|nr:MAG: hypothetical protein A4E73_00288 [Syntrophaceae bacterium PtaU1.Bin231]
MSFFRSLMTAMCVGKGSDMTSKSSFSRAFFISTPRVWLLQAMPWKMTARRLSRCDRLALSSRTPSIQRETGMPGMFIVYAVLPPPASYCRVMSKRDLTHS